MQHVFLVSSGADLATVVALTRRVDAGAIEDRVLLVANPSLAAEAVPAVHERPEFAGLVAQFGRVVELGPLAAPSHPSGWLIQADSHHAAVTAAQLAAATGLDLARPHTVWVSSIGAAPGMTVATVLVDADLVVYEHGYAAYGPTPTALYPWVGQRVRAVHHLDLVPGFEPALLHEFGTPLDAVPVRAFLDVVAETDAVPSPVDGPVVVVLGQHTDEEGTLSDARYPAVLEQLIEAALEAGLGTVLVRPHPRRVSIFERRAVEAFADRGVRLLPADGLVESLYATGDVRLVVGCFSSGLATASAAGIPTLAVGAKSALETLRPFVSVERSAMVLSDLLHRSLDGGTETPAVEDLAVVRMVMGLSGLATQPALLADRAHDYDAQVADPESRGILRRYLSRVRVEELVPGAYPPKKQQAPVVEVPKARRFFGRSR